MIMRFFKDLVAFGFFNIVIIMKSMPIRRKRDYVYLIIFWVFMSVALFATRKLWVIGVWFLSVFLSNWAVFRLRIWTEHVGTDSTHRLKASWWQRWLFLPHNTWYHYEHHEWPWVPFYNLSKARIKLNEPIVISFTNLTHFFSSKK